MDGSEELRELSGEEHYIVLTTEKATFKGLVEMQAGTGTYPGVMVAAAVNPAAFEYIPPGEHRGRENSLMTSPSHGQFTA